VTVATQQDVRRIALSFPQSTESDREFSFRASSASGWRVSSSSGSGGSGWVPKKPKVPHPGVIVLPVADLGDKQALLATDPQTFFTTEHYDGLGAVLVRLPEVDTRQLTELNTDAWRVKAPAKLREGLEGW
jgi:hypothetical protein